MVLRPSAKVAYPRPAIAHSTCGELRMTRTWLYAAASKRVLAAVAVPTAARTSAWRAQAAMFSRVCAVCGWSRLTQRSSTAFSSAILNGFAR